MSEIQNNEPQTINSQEKKPEKEYDPMEIARNTLKDYINHEKTDNEDRKMLKLIANGDVIISPNGTITFGGQILDSRARKSTQQTLERFEKATWKLKLIIKGNLICPYPDALIDHIVQTLIGGKTNPNALLSISEWTGENKKLGLDMIGDIEDERVNLLRTTNENLSNTQKLLYNFSKAEFWKDILKDFRWYKLDILGERLSSAGFISNEKIIISIDQGWNDLFADITQNNRKLSLSKMWTDWLWEIR